MSKTQFDEEKLKNGLISILESKAFAEVLPTYDGYLKALKLKAEGFKDFVNLLLNEIATTRGLRLLTRDREIIKFVQPMGYGLLFIFLFLLSACL
ncbi:MAG: hypothetical protein WED07_00360 [Candidatus Freyarchaeum deiterrae]